MSSIVSSLIPASLVSQTCSSSHECRPVSLAMILNAATIMSDFSSASQGTPDYFRKVRSPKVNPVEVLEQYFCTPDALASGMTSED